MKIKVYNDKIQIYESFESNSLDFIRRSYDTFQGKDTMTEDDYRALALEIVKKRYADSRFDNLEWTVETVEE